MIKMQTNVYIGFFCKTFINQENFFIVNKISKRFNICNISGDFFFSAAHINDRIVFKQLSQSRYCKYFFHGNLNKMPILTKPLYFIHLTVIEYFAFKFSISLLLEPLDVTPKFLQFYAANILTNFPQTYT